jgi:hypothetical protein
VASPLGAYRERKEGIDGIGGGMWEVKRRGEYVSWTGGVWCAVSDGRYVWAG